MSDVANDAIASGNLNADNNTLSFGFASLFASFPGSNEADLAKITFDIDPSATDYAQLDLVGSSNAAGFEFDLQSQQIAVVATGDSSEAAESEFSINSETGEVTLNANPDFESQFIYSFEITSDRGRSSQELVFIINTDEASPIFDQYTVTADPIDDGTAAGQVIHIAQADDSADYSEGFTYGLTGDDADKFSIDANTGVCLLYTSPSPRD